MAYLRCANNTNVSGKQIVLLHGASFSKETWESHEMLIKFCNGAKMVIALDFPVSTNYQGLIAVIEELQTPSETEWFPPIGITRTPRTEKVPGR